MRRKPTDNRNVPRGTEMPKTEEAQAELDAIDDLLDEIDATLEENALEVTRTYRQKGGQ